MEHPAQPIPIPGAKSPAQAVMNAGASDRPLSATAQAYLATLRSFDRPLSPALS
jgi:aryl-alcohol dehydrogenase-like predicted oxidoreductase